MKKNLVLGLLLISVFVGGFACSSENNNAKFDKTESKGRKEYQSITEMKYMGGLSARSETSDAMIMFYVVNNDPVAVIMEFGEYYFGSYYTEDTKLVDGTEYTKIVVEGKIYGYHFDDEGTGIVVDQKGNKYEAKKIDESVAIEMFNEALEKK